MNISKIYHACNKLLKPHVVIRNKGNYKIIKRPDPRNFKISSQETGPSLMEIIKEKIRLNGPLTVAEYMHIVATNPTEGYYMRDDVIGETGDFITSPEISQLFGEILAIWFYSETRKMGSGKPLQLVELGPGKGTLIMDFLRVLYRMRYEPEDLSIHLVEISETMMNVQASRMCVSHRQSDIELPYFHEGETISGIKVYWYNDLKKVPKNFSWYIAHEFFDVLPVHKFEKTEGGWREVMIDLDTDGKLRYRISGFETQSAKVLIRPPLETGDRTHLEISARALGVGRTLANRVDEFGGLALIADYGHEGEKGDTFRAFQKHKIVDPLENVGTCDLTADVDFTQLKISASKVPTHEHYAIVVGPVTQKDFLQRTQAEARLQVLMAGAKTEEERENIKKAYEMLVDPTQMGERFKFMAFYPSAMEEILQQYPPLGFTTLKS